MCFTARRVDAGALRRLDLDALLRAVKGEHS